MSRAAADSSRKAAFPTSSSSAGLETDNLEERRPEEEEEKMFGFGFALPRQMLERISLRRTSCYQLRKLQPQFRAVAFIALLVAKLGWGAGKEIRVQRK